MNTENRVSPQAPEIEEAIIGACLIEQRAIPLIADKLRPEMFYVLRHQLIYAAILAMYHAGMENRHPHRKRRAFPPRKARRGGRSVRHHPVEQQSGDFRPPRISRADRTREISTTRNDLGIQQTTRLLARRNDGHRRLVDGRAQPARPSGRRIRPQQPHAGHG